MILQSVHLFGILRGTIWSPPVQATMEWEKYLDGPFPGGWGRLLREATGCGDFQSCKFQDLWGYARYYDPARKWFVEKPLRIVRNSRALRSYIETQEECDDEQNLGRHRP